MSEESQMPTLNAPTKKHNREMFLLALVVGIIVICLLVVGILPRLKRNTALAQGVKEAKGNVPEVVIARPKLVPDAGLNLPGNIEAIKQTTINARSTGYLRHLFVDIGSHVRTGQVLAEIQAPDMDQQADQANAQTAQARAVVSQSQADVNRQRASVAQTQADVAKQRATVEQTQAQLASAVAAQAQAQAAEQGAEAQITHAQQALGVQQANLTQQQAQLNLAQTTYTRYQGLVKDGFDTQQDLDQAFATLKTTQATVASAQAQIQSAEADVIAAQKAVESAKSAVTAAQANIKAAQKNVQANQASLVSTEATVKYSQESVQVSRATVNANLASVTANLANQRRYAVMQAFQRVMAPFDGVITARNVDAGALIVADNSGASASSGTSSATTSNSTTGSGGTGMLVIARTDTVRIQISVPQAFVPALSTGSNARVTVRELPGKVFTGTVTLRAGAMDTASRTQAVEVHLPNPGGVLVPGMYAQVNIKPVHPPMSLRVPGTTLIVDANGTRVGIVKKDMTVHLQPVVIGRDFGTDVEILSGLTGHEKLVNNPSDLLKDNDKVQIAPPSRANAVGGRGSASTGRSDESDSGTEAGGAPGSAGADQGGKGAHGGGSRRGGKGKPASE